MITGTLKRFKQQIKANGAAMVVLNLRIIDLSRAIQKSLLISGKIYDFSLGIIRFNALKGATVISGERVSRSGKTTYFQPRPQGLSSLPLLSLIEVEKRDPGNEVGLPSLLGSGYYGRKS